MHICYGDSITKGVPGVSFVKYLSDNYQVENKGLGGDTLIGLKNRIFFNNKENNDYYIIQIGTNDLLLPFLKNRSPMWSKQVEKIVKSGRIPCQGEDQFRSEYKNLAIHMKEEAKKFKAISIPCIGEDLNSSLNEKVDKYNDIIKEVSLKHGFDYIDFNSWQKRKILKFQSESNYFIPEQPYKMIIDSIMTSILPISNYLSLKRGLITTIDGCHLNNRGAKGLAVLIEEKLE